MKKPFLHALSAFLYIVCLILIASNFEHALPDESLFAPMIMLSLLVLSVALMSFIFFYEPVTLYIENKKKESVAFFVKTLGSFAGLVALLLIYIFLK